jgi:hypothetical protein
VIAALISYRFRNGLNRVVCGNLVPNLVGCNVIG